MRFIWSANRRAISNRVSKVLEGRGLFYGIAVVLLVAMISIALTLQGWKSRVPAFDLLTYIYGVHNLLESGTLPQHGDTGSYGSYKPPGTAWLMLPSALLFPDPRLSEYIGTSLLHIFTLLGLFLLARSYLGVSCAYLAVLLYGVSHHGLFLAGSLWPNGRPDFYIWVIFFTSWWVVRKDARYLAAALTTWALGMYVDMAIAPALFILPAAWLYYQPPVRLRPLLVAGAIVLIVWSPYLKFEASRGFADMRSQLLQQGIFPANYRTTWCDSSLTLRQFEDASSTSEFGLADIKSSLDESSGRFNMLLRFGRDTLDKVLSNFLLVAPVPGASIILLLLTLSSLLILSVSGSPTGWLEPITRPPTRRKRLTWIAVGMILCGLLISAFAYTFFFLIRDGAPPGPRISFLLKWQKILVASGIALLAGPWVVSAADRVLIRMGVNIQTDEKAKQTRLLVFSLVIPWIILLLFAEPGKPERFWWVWPLQVMFFTAFFTNILPRFRIPQAVIWIGLVLVIVIVIYNPFLRWRVGSWAKTGWAGPDAEGIQVVDIVARQIQAERKDRAAIGYHTFIYPFMAKYNITNPIYKVGAEFDLLLLYRHHIVNTNRCAEGVAADDEYRIVEPKPKPPVWSPKQYFVVPDEGQYHLMYQVGSYQVYKRD